MKLHATLIMILALGALVPAQTPEIDWLDDLGIARKTARETGRPLLIVFR